MEFDASASKIRFRRPHFPQFIDEVILRNLRVGAGTVDLALVRRRGEAVGVSVLNRQGPVVVETLA